MTNTKGSPLILRKPYLQVIKLKIHLIIGRIIAKLYSSYYLFKLKTDTSSYQFQGDCLTEAWIEQRNEYVNKGAIGYKSEQLVCENIENMSEYFPYSQIEKEIGDKAVSVCNIGCFYCGADYRFLQKNPKSTVYALDFGDIISLNKNITHPQLKLYPGYPLRVLERFLGDEPKRFDYAIFSRTANLINISQLIKYVEILSQLADNIIFLEVGKLSTYSFTSLDVDKIDLMNPVRMYMGMYIHNYTKLLNTYGYEIIDKRILNCNVFDQELSPDHDFIYVHGLKSKGVISYVTP